MNGNAAFGPEVLSPEPVHPNITGHGLIAYALFQALHEG